MGGGVRNPGIGNSGPLRTCDAWVFLTARENLRCVRPFAAGGSGPCAVILSAGADGTCTRSNLASVTSAGTSAGSSEVIGRATVGDGADGTATAGVSPDTGLSGCGIINTAMSMRAKPVGNAIHPAHLAVGITRRRICWSRDLGPGSDGDGSTSPCHSHKPVSLVSVLINAVGGDIGAFPVMIGALPCAWPTNSSSSACMAHNPLSVAAPISSVRSVRRPRTGSGRIGFAAAPTRRRWPHRLDGLLARQIGDQSNHRIEVRRRQSVIFKAEGR
jgi:hypothetical protein